MLMSSSIALRHNDVTIGVVVKQDAGGWRINFSTFLNEKKDRFFLSVFILWFSYYVSDIFCKF